jgi:tocopherol O-methyltransferase
MARFEVADIRRYYDRQTAGFLALGQGGDEGAIHRAVWAPGVTSRRQAFHFVEDRIAGWLAPIDDARPPHVVDLGCGVGGSLCHLAGQVPLRGTGITLSPVQARLATARIAALGLADRVRCLVGDYNDLPDDLEPADLAFAIESFVHGPSPERFFASAARLVRPGGRLVICDDIRRPARDPRAATAVAQFTRGWHVNTLVTRDELAARAGEAGFTLESATDLTPWLELDRPRDRALALAVSLFGWLPLRRTPFAHVVGGVALQRCLTQGWVAYELACFRRPERPGRH